MKLKKIIGAVFLGALALSMSACGSAKKTNEASKESTNVESVQSTEVEALSTEKKDVIVFAAASMTDVLADIKQAYEKEHQDINLTFNFDSSGTLKSQILEGADCDLFVSAAQKQMNELDPENEKYNGKVSIDKESRIDLLENKVCLVVSGDNEKNIESFEDLNTDKVSTIALGNEDVPVGQYSEEILKKLGIFDQIQSKVTYGTNVREVTSWVKEKAADAGIIYATDAKVFDLNVVSIADDSLLENKVIYPAAVLENAKHKQEAKDFLEFLQKNKAKESFKKFGFSPLK